MIFNESDDATNARRLVRTIVTRHREPSRRTGSNRFARAANGFYAAGFEIKNARMELKPTEFDEKEATDSMRAAAARLKVPLELVKECKRRGSPAFRGSRVYLRPLAEMIAANEEPDSLMFPIPTSLESNSETVKESREVLRLAIRCGFLTTGEILEIILDQIIEAWGPKLESKEFGKAPEIIHVGFGCAVMLLEADFNRDTRASYSAGCRTLND
jgi:hypothetical protein